MMAAALDDELRHRMEMIGRPDGIAVFGGWEVALKGGRTSEWDAEELESVLIDLREQGEIRAGDVTEVIRHPAPYVRRSEANQLVKRLSGRARAAVEACRRWNDKRPTLEVAPSVALHAPDPEPALDPREDRW